MPASLESPPDALRPATAAAHGGDASLNADSQFDSGWSDAPGEGVMRVRRWPGWRRRALVALIVLGLAGLAVLIQLLTALPHIDARWAATPDGEVELSGSADPALAAHAHQVLRRITPDDGSPDIQVDARLLRRSLRWVILDADREQVQALQLSLTRALAGSRVTLHFDDASAVPVRPTPRGLVSLPLTFWLLCGFGFSLCLVASVVLLATPNLRNAVYSVMAWCQAANLTVIAIETTLELGLPDRLARWDMPLRMTFDLATAAAMVSAAALHPRRLPGAAGIVGAAALGAMTLVALFEFGLLRNAWWWTQGSTVAFGLVAIGLLSWSYQIELHPFALVLRRFGVLTVTTWVLLTIALAGADRISALPHSMADIGSMVWYVFLASLLMLVPYLASTPHWLREFSLLAAVCTIATSLELIFVSLLGFSQFASLTLSLFVSMTIYASARQWVLNQLLGSSRLTTEHLFEQLYRVAREVEAQPQRAPALLGRLVGDLFDPLEVRAVADETHRTRVASDGSSLLVPVPRIGADAPAAGSVMMRFAQRGRRLFSSEDARLTDRIVEQLARAVDFDRAVERGRHEERLRLAQDLHDDIGARLLTIMYQAESPEQEDYVRHTLQDLKTLTRGLAAASHRLSHASAEWKADLTHRLKLAHVDVKWSFVYDDDVALTVVHWSALTRVLRELVSNTIAHAQAKRMEIDFRLERDRLELVVSDDGVGTAPQSWSPGLGLGGVRKRVKQLGGSVEWREAEPRGVLCRVVIGGLSTRR